MKKKSLGFILLLAMGLVLLSGCSTNEPAENQTTNEGTNQGANQGTNEGTNQGTNEGTEVDVVTTASIVNDETAFLKAISKDGTWIIATLNDLTIDKDLVLEGEFTNKDVKARKIALYTQDENRTKTARFTLTAPKLTIKSENASFVGGTFVGDIYVEANGFTVDDAKIEGNVYFASEEYKASHQITNNGSVTGKTEVKK
ncbi:putative component of type VI protein secretion system [Paenibacillus anaericanus]|uniref:hypothetical protein n=1 Tax=Paenibacillus anaericanus TaxID=170367 RepID=UPI00277FB1DB|nr:hypothetical protein [Paenibacillus anaericanus]MDQ0087967.1 putative component of type VI protein secretion system [Paenibacillus anaericanus]